LIINGIYIIINKQEKQENRKEHFMHSTAKEQERAILVGIYSDRDAIDINASLDELTELAHTAGISVLARLTQSRPAPNPSTYIGKGKLDELAELVDLHDPTIIILMTRFLRLKCVILQVVLCLL